MKEFLLEGKLAVVPVDNGTMIFIGDSNLEEELYKFFEIPEGAMLETEFEVQLTLKDKAEQEAV